MPLPEQGEAFTAGQVNNKREFKMEVNAAVISNVSPAYGFNAIFEIAGMFFDLSRTNNWKTDFEPVSSDHFF